jgi:hypothetical protein
MGLAQLSVPAESLRPEAAVPRAAVRDVRSLTKHRYQQGCRPEIAENTRLLGRITDTSGSLTTLAPVRTMKTTSPNMSRTRDTPV